MTEEAGRAVGQVNTAQQESAIAAQAAILQQQQDPQNDGHAEGGAAMNTAGQGSDEPGGAGVTETELRNATSEDPSRLVDEPQDEGRAPAQKAPELGDTVFLFERNHDPVTSEVLDGYQDAKVGTLVGLDEDTGHADIKVGGETSAPVTSHKVPYKSMAVEGDNYWSQTAD